MSSPLFEESLASLPLGAKEYVHLPRSITHIFLEKLFHSSSSSILYLLPPGEDKNYFMEFFKEKGIPAFFSPFYDLLPYEDGIPTLAINIQRIQTLFSIANKTKGIYLVPLKSFLFGVPSKQNLEQELSQLFSVGQEVERETLLKLLTTWGYTRASNIEEPSQFTVKGEIIEIADALLQKNIRLHFSYDTIEKIFLCESGDSRNSEAVESIYLHAPREFYYTPKRHKQFVDSLKLEKTPHQIEEFEKSMGETQTTHLIPFFYKTSLLNLFSEFEHPVNLVISQLLELEGQEKRYLREIKELFSSSFNHTKIMLPPSAYYFSLTSLLKDYQPTIFLSPFSPKEEIQHKTPEIFDVSTILKETPSYNGKIEMFAIDLEKYPNFTPYLLVSSSESKDKIQTIFSKYDIIVDSSLKQGVIDLVNRRLFFTEQDLFGKFASLKKKTDFLKDSSPIEHFSELSKGDFIVHIHHGIGIYQGIEKMAIMGTQKDYIKIAYAAEEMLYTPIEQIFLVHKYMGSTSPQINQLGGKKWETQKSKVIRSLEEMSEDLVLLYETRKKLSGFSYPADTPFQEQFESEFPYTLTEGQAQAVIDIKKDMESPIVMDRLVCGDVGYGKTEVAFRGIFKAISSGKQVVFLAPTTLLVEQHYHTMSVRFSQFPIRIAMLSRTVSPKDQKQILEELSLGKIDVIVGTHALFSDKVKFKNLGLFVIDEEQRFGVKHKEKLKENNPLVDTLTLSATPIPRTLHMGLSSFRDMSLITTPPISRLPIKTYVMPFSDETLVSAARRELERGGQIFMIHNRVSTINSFSSFIQKLLPEARVAVGHAQMSTKEMESIFVDFIAHKIDILISTTIVENGIDISNANTIIIDKPELLGLGELYQLRGRVGRGQRQGYAYLFYDPLTGLTHESQQRLQTIEEHTTLGSGFQIAMRDLEIRGAGNLLGKAQSGLFNEVGMTLYGDILKKVVHKIKGQEEKDSEPIMDLPFEGGIPLSYVVEDKERFQFYKVLMQASTKEELQTIRESSIATYGPIPPEMKELFKVSEIKILARKLGIKELRCRETLYEIYFFTQPKINTTSLGPWISEKKAKIVGATAIAVDRSLFASDFLEDLSKLLENLSSEQN